MEGSYVFLYEMNHGGARIRTKPAVRVNDEGVARLRGGEERCATRSIVRPLRSPPDSSISLYYSLDTKSHMLPCLLPLAHTPVVACPNFLGVPSF